MQQFSTPTFLSNNTIGKHFSTFEPGTKQCFLTFDPDQNHVFRPMGAKVENHRKCFFDL
jgi:hypothetical protein